MEKFIKQIENKGVREFIALPKVDKVANYSVNKGAVPRELVGLLFEFGRFPQDEYAGREIDDRLKNYLEDYETISAGGN
jgi:hypothetical protein